MRIKLLTLSAFLFLAAACGKSSTVAPATVPDPMVTFYGLNKSNEPGNDALIFAYFNNPSGIAIDPAGNIYIADTGNQLIRKVTNDGLVSVYAGNTGKMGMPGHVDGNALSAQFNYPRYLALDPAGNLYVSENDGVRKISPAGMVSTLTTYTGIFGITTDALGNIYGATSVKNTIVKISPAGVLTIYAGTGVAGSKDGPAYLAEFNFPSDVKFDKSGNLYVADRGNNLIKKITANGTVSTFAGNGNSVPSDSDGAALSASFFDPYSLAFNAAGDLYVLELADNKIRKITIAGIVSTVAGNGVQGQSANGDALKTSLGTAYSIATDPSGDIYFVGAGTYPVGKVTFPSK
jgi:sugar lactone lactonase YvrE